MLYRWQNPLLVLSECEGRVASFRVAPGAAALAASAEATLPAIPRRCNSLPLQLFNSLTLPLCNFPRVLT
jgi:hypothetical protein